jgi:exoribonuclease II
MSGRMNQSASETDLAVLARRAMLERGLEPDFSAEALQQLERIPNPGSDSDRSIRDLRALLWCSIDNDSSLDLDQLTVSERLASDRVKILIAVADVDVLVKRDSAIDRHAHKNTTSVYTAAKIFPMLPEKLSTNLTSLADDQNRLALVVEMTVEPDGSVSAPDVYRALVHNHAKLAYRSVASWLEGKSQAPERVTRVPGLDGQLRTQDEAAQRLRRVRYLHGALDLETIEPEVLIKNGAIADLRAAQSNRARELIEDFMIAANGVTAQFLQNKGWPSLQRVVRSPANWERICAVARELGEQLPARPDSRALAEFMTRRREADPLRFPDLSLTIVKLLGAGEYVVQAPGQASEGHFGLAVREYSHSTAPNRRFPDLITQRLLKAVLANQLLPYDLASLSELATHCTEQEDAAKKVERQIRKSAAALFLSGRIGERFDAIVTGASDKGTWVRLLQPPAEGKLVDPRPGMVVGAQLRVKLSNLNVARGFIDFVRA